ncbi:MAG: endonuclease Q family protein [bacterium]|nr:endonuclease Q family protein [bacterium]
MEFIADFHIHSKYSRATSPLMNVEELAIFARLKGIRLLGTGDFTHPLWIQELRGKLKLDDSGLYRYNDTFFILTTEVCNIFYKNGKPKRIHNIIFSPNFQVAERINRELQNFGNLQADGRPMLNLACKDLVEIVLSIDSNCLIVPAHIWTPWYSLFGSNTGFDSVYECFEEETKQIFCLETGLSSDPKMNWRLSTLDRFTLISNSDAHSPKKIGREANMFNTELSYHSIISALRNKNRQEFLGTIEFFPQEGKYHYDGHRSCKVCFSPEETKRAGNRCPKCGKMITIGVMHRVKKLSDRESGFVPDNSIPFRYAIPLEELIANVKGVGVDSSIVEKEYKALVTRFGGEFEILFNIKEDVLLSKLPTDLAKCIIKVREEKVRIQPGYDGVYGKIEVPITEEERPTQLSLF